MSELSQVACINRKKGEPSITEEELATLHSLVPAWRIVQEDGVRKLRNNYTFEAPENIRRFVERVMGQANKANHHPVIQESEKEAVVDWWTHSIDDLHPNDFIMAAKTDGAFSAILVGSEGDMGTDEDLPTLPEIPKFAKVVAHRYGEPKKSEE